MKKALVFLMMTAALLFICLSASGESAYEEHWIDSQDLSIYGRLYLPEQMGETCPMVILSHGFGGTWEDSKLYIPRFLEAGVGCYAFDFPGGAPKNKSGGSFTEMSVLTEKQALLDVIDAVAELLTTGKILLAGFSQGGVVTGLAAVERADVIAGEILFYPALCISDDGHKAYGS